MVENRVLGRIFGTKREEIDGESLVITAGCRWRRLPPDIVKQYQRADNGRSSQLRICQGANIPSP
jgi:hypothetical protein